MRAFAHREHALNTWDNFKGALVGLAADRFIQYAGEIIPGFMDQFHRAERRARCVTTWPFFISTSRISSQRYALGASFSSFEVFIRWLRSSLRHSRTTEFHFGSLSV